MTTEKNTSLSPNANGPLQIFSRIAEKAKCRPTTSHECFFTSICQSPARESRTVGRCHKNALSRENVRGAASHRPANVADLVDRMPPELQILKRQCTILGSLKFNRFLPHFAHDNFLKWFSNPVNKNILNFALKLKCSSIYPNIWIKKLNFSPCARKANDYISPKSPVSDRKQPKHSCCGASVGHVPLPQQSCTMSHTINTLRVTGLGVHTNITKI